VEYTSIFCALIPHGTIPMFRLPEVRFLKDVASTAVTVQKSKRIHSLMNDPFFLEITA